ncbi:MAG TPA: PD-(D/E)XK nuclease family protein [Azospirillaceae bacterium]|nr:PD-(D/E)XK nuclease family protein [Azospirillaceae bacterium]
MSLLPPEPYGVFRYAPSELSSSGFWAWIFAGLAEDPERAAGQRAVAEAVLAAAGCATPIGQVSVEREYALGRGAGRVDIRVAYDETEILIENKVKAIPTAEQLRRYVGRPVNRSGLVPMLFSTAFDDQVIEALPGVRVGRGRPAEEFPWTIFRPEDLRAAAVHGRALHPLIDDYVRSLERLLLKRETIKRLALSDDRDGLTEALGTHEGQWYLMKALTDGIPACCYQGSNTGGRPWTQCRFTDRPAPERDALFYRIDFDMGGGRGEWQPYLSLQQYQNPADPGKGTRLETLRAHAVEALASSLASSGSRYTPDDVSYAPRDIRIPQLESAVIRFRVWETPFPALRVFFRQFHDSFVDRANPDNGFILLTP